MGRDSRGFWRSRWYRWGLQFYPKSRLSIDARGPLRFPNSVIAFVDSCPPSCRSGTPNCIALPLDCGRDPDHHRRGLNSTMFLHGDKVLNFRRLTGLEILSWFLLLVALPLAAIAGTAASNTAFWADGFFIVLALSLPIRFLTIASISSVSSWKKFAASALPPILSIRSFSIIGP